MESHTNRTGIAVSVSLVALFMTVAWHAEMGLPNLPPGAHTNPATSAALAPARPIASGEQAPTATTPPSSSASAGGVEELAGAGARTAATRALNALDTDGSATCGPGQYCHFTCFDGRCTTMCEAGSTCTATCYGGDCTQICRDDAVCTFSCEGGRCKRACSSEAVCSASCRGGHCNTPDGIAR